MAQRTFEEFVRSRGPVLLQTALLLVGGDRQHAEDLLQDVLFRLSRSWARVDDPEGYARRSLTNAAIDRWRRLGRSSESLTATTPEAAAAQAADPLLRMDIVAVLQRLPDRQRVALVLRYLHDLSVEQTATEMGCSVGAVKTHCHRGLAALRERMTALEART